MDCLDSKADLTQVNNLKSAQSGIIPKYYGYNKSTRCSQIRKKKRARSRLEISVRYQDYIKI